MKTLAEYLDSYLRRVVEKLPDDYNSSAEQTIGIIQKGIEAFEKLDSVKIRYVYMPKDAWEGEECPKCGAEIWDWDTVNVDYPSGSADITYQYKCNKCGMLIEEAFSRDYFVQVEEE